MIFSPSFWDVDKELGGVMLPRNMKFALAVLVLVFCACTENHTPTQAERRKFLEKVNVDDLVDYCVLLEHLYGDPNSDEFVVATLEHLIAKRTLMVRALEAEGTEFGIEAIDAYLAVLNLSENDAFGDAWDQAFVLDANVEYLKGIEFEMMEHRKYLIENTQIIL